MSRICPIVIATGYGLHGPGSIPGSAKFFSSPQLPDGVGAPPSLLSIRYRGAISPEIKRLGRDTDHSHRSSSEVENGGAIPPLPHMSSRHSA
jgi:hypothetical protein